MSRPGFDRGNALEDRVCGTMGWSYVVFGLVQSLRIIAPAEHVFLLFAIVLFGYEIAGQEKVNVG